MISLNNTMVICAGLLTSYLHWTSIARSGKLNSNASGPEEFSTNKLLEASFDISSLALKSDKESEKLNIFYFWLLNTMNIIRYHDLRIHVCILEYWWIRSKAEKIFFFSIKRYFFIITYLFTVSFLDFFPKVSKASFCYDI